MNIRTDHAPHSDLENEVDEYLRALNFHTHAATYHETLPPTMTRTLQNRFSPTALYLRSRADRIAVHKSLPIEFEWEIKSHANPRYNDLTLELLPFLFNLARSRTFGIKILYVFRVNDHEGAFWSWPPPAVRVCFYPPRPEWQEIKEPIRKLTEHYLHQSLIPKPSGGSNDPFVIIDRETICAMPDWRVLISNLVTDGVDP